MEDFQNEDDAYFICRKALFIFKHSIMPTINKYISSGHHVRGNRSRADGQTLLAVSQRVIELIQGDQGLGIALVAAQKAEVLVTIVDTSQETINKGLNSVGPLTFPFSSSSRGHFI